ncbi:MAG: threonine synthase [Candidatus Xiphinematobacter sp.]|nr:MAG: threonine synthase [Candidatus Xiphinematobacter sp.]QQY10384.1 MAG: threonine synthase [Candidatus Xiphinematobacter sp.]QQY11117.1 MAG: threonine synthase [Candidatus Xiphinematobacter sp.]
MKQPAWQGHGIINRYRRLLPLQASTPVVSLGEGSTPLVYSSWLSKSVGEGNEVYIKCEGLNPTGSFKDRGMTVAISEAVERHVQIVICASTGNTSAAAAAYAARAGLSCAVLLPHGQIAAGKLLQAFLCGAKIISLHGSFDDALNIIRQLSRDPIVEIVNSINPLRIEGQKTAAFEVVDELGEAPDFHFLPIGNAGNITAYWRGYREYFTSGKCGILPKMIGFQALGAAPLVLRHIVPNPDTVASAIRIGNPASWRSAASALEQSRGFVDTVTDTEILSAQVQLARKEGIFVEPASAASIAGLLKCVALCPERSIIQKVQEGARIVCTVTGHGLKDPNTPVGTDMCPIESDATVDSVRNILEIG